MQVNVAVPEEHVDAPVLDAALESVTRLNEAMLQRGEIPTFERGLRTHGIRWRPEPPGGEHFDNAKLVLRRGWGDCDDLAPYHAASLRHSGEDPGARAIVYRSGPKRWHAVVRRGDGSIDDPSKRAGMGPGVAPGNRGATVPMLATASTASGCDGAYILRPQLALRPVATEHGARWQARADMPWHYQEHQQSRTLTPTDYAMATLHTAPVASTALVGALDDAIELAVCGGYADPEHLDRLEALSAACQGATYDELADEYGEEHARAATQAVGSFFGGLGRMIKKAAPFISKAVSFIPGVGPVASTALDVATHFIPSGGGTHPQPNSPLNAGPELAHAMLATPGSPSVPAVAHTLPTQFQAPSTSHSRICIPAFFG